MKLIPCGVIAIWMLTNSTLPTTAQSVNTYGFPIGPREVQTAPGAGIVVNDVDKGFPAERAGIRPGDIIVNVNGNPISSYKEIDADLASRPGRPLTIDINRGGKHLRVRVAPILTSLGWLQGTTTKRDYPIQVQPHWALGVVYYDSGFILVPCTLDPECGDDE